MSSQTIWIFFLVCFLIVLQNEVIAGIWNITAEEDLELEKQLKMLNKPATKSILTNHGDIYDRVDFYKQPAFDHPLLKNYKADFSVEAPIRPNKQMVDVSHDGSEDIDIGLTDGGCPFGTVPIRRVTKDDLIREKVAEKIRPLRDDDVPGAHYAVCRTIPSTARYNGAAGAGSVWQPEVIGQQYSAGRMKISNGPDSLEVGWRVDPTLFGDKRSHLYIRTDVGQTHCFNTRCPGFIVVDRSIPLGIRIKISHRGGGIKQIPFFLSQDINNGNWYFKILDQQKVIGYWPKKLYTSLGDSAASVEWGGEVFGPPGTPKPSMGSGYRVTGNNTAYDAYFARLSITTGTEKRTSFDFLPFMTTKLYNAVCWGRTNTTYFDYIMFYGGSGAPKIHVF